MLFRSPPMPAFYNHPQSLDDVVDHIVARMLDQFGIEARFAKRWSGEMRRKPAGGRTAAAQSKESKEEAS